MTGEADRARELLSGSVEERFVEPLARYAALVLEANTHFNLTGAKSAEQFVPHILDSLTVVPYVQEPYIDIGSGAGLPGIPVALVTGAKAVLIDATSKKAAFLAEAVEALGLGGRVSVRAIRAEAAGRDSELREQFQSATVRAVASASAALELTAPFLALEGIAILQRGADEGWAALSDVAGQLGCAVDSEEAAPKGRRIVLVRKTAPIAERFPRRVGLAQKRPLT